jgi:peptide/nickel transport system substrate-binding protein
MTHDSGHGITFKLKEPDPEFLHKLALPFAYVVPKGTTTRDAGTKPVPATGPYIIASFERGEQIEFVRNPEFE